MLFINNEPVPSNKTNEEIIEQLISLPIIQHIQNAGCIKNIYTNGEYTYYECESAERDIDAIDIPQHGVGFSFDQKIGTDNLNDCIALILYDPISKKSGLAHIDSNCFSTSIVDMMYKFPKNTKLDAYLFGGINDYKDELILKIKENNEESRSSRTDRTILNLINILTSLKGYHYEVNIKVANIFDKHKSYSVIFDPQNGTYEYKSPKKAINDNNYFFTKSKSLIPTMISPLFCAFDSEEGCIADNFNLSMRDKYYIIELYFHQFVKEDKILSELYLIKACIKQHPIMTKAVEILLKEDTKLFNDSLTKLFITEVLTCCFYLPINSKNIFLEKLKNKLNEFSSIINNNDDIEDVLEKYAKLVNKITFKTKNDDNLAHLYWIRTLQADNNDLYKKYKIDTIKILKEKANIFIAAGKQDILQLIQDVDTFAKSNIIHTKCSEGLEIVSNLKNDILDMNNRLKMLTDRKYESYTKMVFEKVDEIVEKKFEEIATAPTLINSDVTEISTTIKDIYNNVISYFQSKLEIVQYKDLNRNLIRWDYESKSIILCYKRKAMYELEQLGIFEKDILQNEPIVENNFINYQGYFILDKLEL